MEDQVCCERFAALRQVSKLVSSYGDYGDESLDIEFNKGANCLEIKTLEDVDLFYFNFCPFCGKVLES